MKHIYKQINVIKNYVFTFSVFITTFVSKMSIFMSNGIEVTQNEAIKP